MNKDQKKGKLVPNDRLYTQTHEWVQKAKENEYRVGITDFAQHELKEVTVIDLPKVGELVEQFQTWGYIESEKGSSELCSPINGQIVAINADNLGDVYDNEEADPKTITFSGDLFYINQKPYETWLMRVETHDEGQFENLLTSEDYEKEIQT